MTFKETLQDSWSGAKFLCVGLDTDRNNPKFPAEMSLHEFAGQYAGRRQLQLAGFNLHTVFELDTLLDYYVERGLMPTEKAQEVMRYIEANQAA